MPLRCQVCFAALVAIGGCVQSEPSNAGTPKGALTIGGAESAESSTDAASDGSTDAMSDGSAGPSDEASDTGTELAETTGSGPSGDSTPFPADAGSACNDWSQLGWHRRTSIAIPALGTPNDLHDVPVPLRLDPRQLEGAFANRADLRFVDEDGTLLAHEIEAIDSDGSTVIWVKVPLLSSATPTGLWMYYDNPSAETEQDASELWSDYVSVHHLSDMTDATGHGHEATVVEGSGPADATGVIGKGQSFDGIDDYLELAGDEAAFDLPDALEISVWIQVGAGLDFWDTIVAKGDEQWRMHFSNDWTGTGQEIEFGTTVVPGTDFNNLPGATGLDDGRWHHIVFSWDGTRKTIYVDGDEDGAADWSGPMRNSNMSVYIGENQQMPGRFFNGLIDELRISAVPRSQSWHRTQVRFGNGDLAITLGTAEYCE